jgi:hypothetical protein
MPNTEIRTEFLLMKNKSNSWNFKTIRDCRYYQLSLSAGYNYIGQGPNALGSRNHLMGFWTDFLLSA